MSSVPHSPVPHAKVDFPRVSDADPEEYGAEEGLDDSFKVVVRVRPPTVRELEGYHPFVNTVSIDPGCKSVTLSEKQQPLRGDISAKAEEPKVFARYRFTFDHVYGPASSQEEVYEKSAKEAVLCILEGYNAAIIAYGQTGTGKTFTMEGGKSQAHMGITPRAVEEIFHRIENDPEPRSKYLVRGSYLQIYNEVISDLLKPERQNLVIREDRRRGVFVDGLSEWVVRSPEEVYGLMDRGAAERATGATRLNELSSRSHAVFIIIVEKSTVLGGGGGDERGEAAADERDWEQFRGIAPGLAKRPAGPGPGQGVAPGELHQCIKVGKLNLVDLAGSERVHITGASGRRLEESKKINQSLSALGNVISALTEVGGPRRHVPYRDSKLTRILEDSLGGNCRTTMMACISPALDTFFESLSTLKFAHRAKTVRNAAVVNEDADQRTLLRRYERELRRLRAELQRRQRTVVDKRQLLAAEEQKRRAEADKLAAITQLAQFNREFMAEKEAKRRLEQRIASMQSQLLTGGHRDLSKTPVFRDLLAREQQRMRSAYEQRLRDLERERQVAEQDKAQAGRYARLLEQQRDIMAALSQRLAVRDAQILTLQEELEAYDAHQKQLEDALDGRTAELIALRKAAMEHTASSPIKSLPLQSALGAWGAAHPLGGGGGGGGGGGPLRDPGSADEAPGGGTIRAHVPSRDGSQAREGVGLTQWRGVGPGPAASVEAVDEVFGQDGDLQADSVHSASPAASPLRRAASRRDSQTSGSGYGHDRGGPQGGEGGGGAPPRPPRGPPSEAPSGASDWQLAAEVQRLRERCSVEAKERAALKTILDAKVRMLVDDLRAALGDAPREEIQQLQRKLGALDQLVSATVMAMR